MTGARPKKSPAEAGLRTLRAVERLFRAGIVLWLRLIGRRVARRRLIVCRRLHVAAALVSALTGRRWRVATLIALLAAHVLIGGRLLVLVGRRLLVLIAALTGGAARLLALLASIVLIVLVGRHLRVVTALAGRG